MLTNTQRYILLGVRSILGLLFLLSGVGKLIDGSNALYMVELLATEFYWLIEYGTLIVILTSVLELILAILLMWGLKLRWVLTGCFLLVLWFTIVVSYFYLQGMSVASCGCFGAFDFGGGLGATLVRNVILLGLIFGGFFLEWKKKSGKPEVNESTVVT
ncbi:MAG: hypothetical protein U5K69_05080 [Balneolaceae bacterium]|nr:hypothetical protein [Balneolaceae bacterium]